MIGTNSDLIFIRCDGQCTFIDLDSIVILIKATIFRIGDRIRCRTYFGDRTRRFNI